MTTFSYYKNQQFLTQKQLIIAQVEPPQVETEQNSLIDYGAQHLIDFGIVLIVFAIVMIIGMLSKQMAKALLFALAFSAFLVVILWSI